MELLKHAVALAPPWPLKVVDALLRGDTLFRFKTLLMVGILLRSFRLPEAGP